MKLFTKVEVEKYSSKISYRDKILFLGSCFANEMGSVMKSLQFNVLVNPFGVLYNPASISNSLERLRSDRKFTESDIIVDNDIYKSLYHSSEFASMSMQQLISKINGLLEQASNHYKESKWVVVSLGTRWVYRLKTSGVVVSNCHKLTQNQFSREALSIEDIVDLLSPYISNSPEKLWLFTISPVRHWKDGAHGNQLSKATLLCAVEELQKRYKNILYFPAYEILLDELRDYRYYSADMLHPSGLAIEYIWKIFEENLIDESAKELISDVNKLNAMNFHKPLFPESAEFQEFEKKRKILGKIVCDKIKNL